MLYHAQRNIDFSVIKVDGTMKKFITSYEPLENTIEQRIGFSIDQFTRSSVYDWITAPVAENINFILDNLSNFSKIKDLIGFTYPEKRFEEITKDWKSLLDINSTEAIEFFSQKASEIKGVEECFLCGKDGNYTLITLVRTENLKDEKRIYDIEYDILRKYGKLNIDFLVLPFEEVIRIALKQDMPVYRREWGF